MNVKYHLRQLPPIFKIALSVHLFPLYLEGHRSYFKHSPFLHFRSFPSCLVLLDVSMSHFSEKVLVSVREPLSFLVPNLRLFFFLLNEMGEEKSRKMPGTVVMPFTEMEKTKSKKKKCLSQGGGTQDCIYNTIRFLPWAHQVNPFPCALDLSTHHSPYFK